MSFFPNPHPHRHHPCGGGFSTVKGPNGPSLITLIICSLTVTLLLPRDFALAASGSYGGGQYHIDGRGLYDQSNPLWREKYLYTGERRGPVVDDDGHGRWWAVMGRRMLWQRQGLDGTVDASVTPADASPDGTEERPPFRPDGDEWRHLHRRPDHLRPRDGFSRGGSSTDSSTSAMFHSNRRGPVDGNLDNNDFWGTSSTSSMQLRPRPPSGQSKGLSIDFQPKRGQVEVDFFGPQEVQRHVPKITHHPGRSVAGASDGATGNATGGIEANATANATHTISDGATVSTALTTGQGHHPEAGRQLVPVSQPHHPPSGGINSNFQLSLSVDPFSTARLLRALALTCVGLVSAFAGTLRLVAPMIAAKRCLTTIGYIFYDHYNGRYIRTAYTRRMRRMQEYEIIAGLRGTGRCLLHILCVGLVGRTVGYVMDRAPCLIRPARICDWWYGAVWISSVYAVGWAMEFWLTSVHTSHPLSLRPTPMIGRSGTSRKKSHGGISGFFNRQRESKEEPPAFALGALVQVPWRIVQRMRDPEEWFTSMLRPRNHSRFYYSNMHSYTPQQEHQKPLKLDTLLFPCTWKPLRVWTSLAVVRAIRLTLTKTASWGDTADYVASMSSKRSLIMRSFVVYDILYGEWKRVFVTERRVALGAFFSTVSLTALLWMVYSVAMVEGITALVLIPAVIARLVSTWMNILLYYDRRGLPSSFGRSPVPSDRKIMELNEFVTT